MKKLLPLLLLLLTQTINAQTYQPFPESGISWREDLRGESFNCCCSAPQSQCVFEDKYEQFFQGDTTIGAYVYHKIYRVGYVDEFLMATSQPFCQTGCENYNPQFYGNLYVGGLRQDIQARKVYFHATESGAQDMLLYDFNLNIGDFLPETYNNAAGTNWVSRIDSVLIGNAFHKRYWLNYLDNQIEYVALIEGIGSTFGLTYNLLPPFELFTELICVKRDLLPVYPNSEAFCSLSKIAETESALTLSFAPNPVDNVSVLQVSTDFEGEQVSFFNQIGRKVDQRKITGQMLEINRNDFEPGIYFFRTVNAKGQVGTGKFVVCD